MAISLVSYDWYGSGASLTIRSIDAPYSDDYPFFTLTGTADEGYEVYDPFSSGFKEYDDEYLANVFLPSLAPGVYELSSNDGLGTIKFNVVGETIVIGATPALWAGSYLTDGGGAHIDLWSSLGWTSGAWSVDLSTSDVPGYEWMGIFPLFPRNGVGEIDGNFLRIDIPRIKQGNFILRFQYGYKNFMMEGTEISSNAELLAINNLSKNIDLGEERARVEPGPLTIPKALILMGSDTKAYMGRQRAQLKVGKEVHAVVMGNAINDFHGEDYYNENWAIPAILFSEYFWLKPPTEPTEYNFVFSAANRGTGTSHYQNLKVTMDTEQIYSPTPSAIYDMTGVTWIDLSRSYGEARYY